MPYYSNNIDKYIMIIESANFANHFIFAKDASAFARCFESNNHITELVNIMGSDSEYSNMIGQRIDKLLNSPCDTNKLHPYDHSIAVYLFAISKTNILLLPEILRKIFDKKLPNLYWANIIYNHLFDKIPLDETQRLSLPNIRLEEKDLTHCLIKPDNKTIFSASNIFY